MKSRKRTALELGCVAASALAACSIPFTAHASTIGSASTPGQSAMDFAIPSQTLKTAMAVFSRQSGYQVLFPYDKVQGMRTKAVSGRMTPDEALQRMLAGTGLKVNHAGPRGIALSFADMERPARGSVQLAGSESAGSAAFPLTGQATAAAAPYEAGNTKEDVPVDIVVTGSRGMPRTVADSPTPVDVISAKDLEKTGKPGLLAALNTLVPSFNVPTRAGGGTSTVISTGGLRGLNPDQTLILVNGKRRHKTSLINAVSSLYNGSVPVDLDLIPTSAVDHIEVLRDGAAAQYGSDAIAGVINIILKDKTSGGSASFTAGQNMDRSDGETYLADASLGVALGDAGFADVFVSAKKQSASNRARPIADTVQLYTPIDGETDPREATADRLITRNYGGFPAQAINTGYNAAYDFGGVELYSFGTFSQRKSELDYTFRYPSNPNSLPELYPNGFRPHRDIREQDFEFTAGLRGEVSGWHWDLATGFGKNRARQTGSNTLNASLGPTSPTSFYIGTLESTEWKNTFDVTKGYAVGGGNLQVSAGLQFRRETYSVIQGDEASSALGTYSYIDSNGVTRVPATGAQAANGFTADDAGHLGRNNLGAYLDLAYDPTSAITIGGAVRFEHYDDSSGDTLIAKLNGRYAVTPWLALRGAVSTGFRAPGLAQQIYATTTGQFRIIDGEQVRLQIKTLPVNSAAAIALGSQPLKPEKSTNFSAGFVLTPIDRLTLTVDAYQIKVKDRIAITSTLTGDAVSAILVANGLSPYISAQYYTNAIDTRTRGIDVVATYSHPLGDLGKMAWNIGYNYNKNIITRISDNPAELASLGPDYVLFDRVSQANLTKNLPKTKLMLGNTTTIGDFTLNTRVVRYGTLASLQNDTTRDRTFGAKWITDAELAWQATEMVQIAVGANNLFNVYPDENGIYSAAYGAGMYPTTSPYGFTGGYYYGRVALSF
ncbi:TonB-dependent receptor [Novosphingobium beihaiensis]|uniref:TonB-dependent receptor n=1 Tax=Novosphingobium beihaiensis TaxID=2930389 RepID=A0ABT0BLM1_9SPHN|nr:TonB-dependent receptor [Novosphingobium beihaiensis]MCJ2185748.1 TonB-dependent receptor [Novosphingobium beihaiensis]